MPDEQDRSGASAKFSIPALLTGHWLSLLGAALVTSAGFSWLFALPIHLRGGATNPYIGLLIFFGIPVVFFAGLALIPVGMFLARRRIAAGLSTVTNRRIAVQRAVVFFAVMTVLNVVIGSQVTYHAVAQMESNQFCGQSCHVMKPEFTGHLTGAHQNVECVGCHVTPGATGFVNAKIAGTRQLALVLTNSFPRPIPAGLASNRLAPSSETCEQCHSRARESGPTLRIISKFNDDQPNTPTKTVLLMATGGGHAGGIHGAHMGAGVEIHYAATDGTRQTIPWVEYRNRNTRETTAYVAAATKPDTLASMPRFEMQCVDCHNRPTHAFDLPEKAVDRALTAGQIPASLPFAKKTGVTILKASYTSEDDAMKRIPEAFLAFYQQKFPDLWSSRRQQIERGAAALLTAYQRNVFPDLKVRWGTYPNHLGHMDSPGCFRCHDENHASAAKKTISQDCSLCHQLLAVDETSPDVLKTLGLAAK